MEHIKKVKAGYLYVALAAILWAVSGTSSKFLFNRGMSPFQLIQFRTTLSFVSLLLWLALTNRSLLKIAFRDLFYFMMLGTLGLAAAQFFYLFAVSKINVAVAILLHYTGPVFVALYSTVILKKKLSRNSVIAMGGTMAGCFLVVGAYNIDLLALNQIGIVGGLLAAFAFATYSIMSEYGVRKFEPWTVLLYGMFFAALLWNVQPSPFEWLRHAYSPIEWWWIFFIGIIGTTTPFGFYFKGVKLILATHASITATLEPIRRHYFFYFPGRNNGPVAGPGRDTGDCLHHFAAMYAGAE